MTEFTFPFDDVEYTASDYAQYIQAMVTGILNRENAGVLENTGASGIRPLNVEETATPSTSVRVRAGSAMLDGRWYYTDADVLVEIPENTDGSGFNRIDLLVLRSNTTNKTITPTLIEGTPASSPSAPSPVRSGAIYDIKLAEVTAPNLFSTITDANIDNSVKTTARLVEAEAGGTGLSISDSDLQSTARLLSSDGAGEFTLLSAPPNEYAGLWHDDSKTGGLEWVDRRESVIYINSLAGDTQPANPLQLDTESDPAGNMRSPLSSNQFFPSAGLYRVTWYIVINTKGAGPNTITFFLNDNGVGTVTDVNGINIQQESRLRTATNRLYYVSRLVEFDGTETLEITESGVNTNVNFSDDGITLPAMVFLKKLRDDS